MTNVHVRNMTDSSGQSITFCRTGKNTAYELKSDGSVEQFALQDGKFIGNQGDSFTMNDSKTIKGGINMTSANGSTDSFTTRTAFDISDPNNDPLYIHKMVDQQNGDSNTFIRLGNTAYGINNSNGNESIYTQGDNNTWSNGTWNFTTNDNTICDGFTGQYGNTWCNALPNGGGAISQFS